MYICFFAQYVASINIPETQSTPAIILIKRFSVFDFDSESIKNAVDSVAVIRLSCSYEVANKRLCKLA